LIKKKDPSTDGGPEKEVEENREENPVLPRESTLSSGPPDIEQRRTPNRNGKGEDR